MSLNAAQSASNGQPVAVIAGVGENDVEETVAALRVRGRRLRSPGCVGQRPSAAWTSCQPLRSSRRSPNRGLAGDPEVVDRPPSNEPRRRSSPKLFEHAQRGGSVLSEVVGPGLHTDAALVADGLQVGEERQVSRLDGRRVGAGRDGRDMDVPDRAARFEQDIGRFVLRTKPANTN